MNEWNAPAATQTAYLLCRECNSVWGAGIEGRAKPVLLPMVRGYPKRLARTSQETVALWTAKTAVVFDRSHPPESQVIPEEHLRYIRQRGEPPPNTVAWISAYEGQKYTALHVSTRSGEEGQWATTFLVDALILQIVSRADVEDRADQFMRETRDFNVQIWPAIGVRRAWPPKHAKDDHMLEGVSFPMGRAPT